MNEKANTVMLQLEEAKKEVTEAQELLKAKKSEMRKVERRLIEALRENK